LRSEFLRQRVTNESLESIAYLEPPAGQKKSLGGDPADLVSDTELNDHHLVAVIDSAAEGYVP
jgi:hypothetical protein